MKVLLVCAGGMSTSILMKKMEKYAAANGIEPFEIAAVGLGAYRDVCDNYDCILMGPQVGYQKDSVASSTGMKVDVIAPADYGIGNCENIFKQIDKLLAA